MYYHRLNDDLLYTALNKYLKPKIDDTEKELRRIESELPNATGHEASSLRTAFEETGVFLDELRELRDELARVADLPYKPNLSDGVLDHSIPSLEASPSAKMAQRTSGMLEETGIGRRLPLGPLGLFDLARSGAGCLQEGPVDCHRT